MLIGPDLRSHSKRFEMTVVGLTAWLHGNKGLGPREIGQVSVVTGGQALHSAYETAMWPVKAPSLT